MGRAFLLWGGPGIPSIRDMTAASRPVRVLAVDDDPDLLDIVAFQLDHLGFTPITATGADEAIAALPGVDVVLTDLNLADGSCAALLEACRRRGIPAVVLSASPAAAAEVRALAPGTQVVAKPVSLPRLREVIEQARLLTNP